MAGVVNRYPQGLLGLLALQSGGDAPHGIGDDAVVAVQAFDLYVNSEIDFLQGSAVTQTSGAWATSNFLYASNPMGPAVGEVWYVRKAGFLSPQFTTAGTVKNVPVIYRSAGTFNTIPLSNTMLLNTTTDLNVVSVDAFWMLPGDVLGLANVQYSDSAPKTYYANLHVARFAY